MKTNCLPIEILLLFSIDDIVVASSQKHKVSNRKNNPRISEQTQTQAPNYTDQPKGHPN